MRLLPSKAKKGERQRTLKHRIRKYKTQKAAACGDTHTKPRQDLTELTVPTSEDRTEEAVSANKDLTTSKLFSVSPRASTERLHKKATNKAKRGKA